MPDYCWFSNLVHFPESPFAIEALTAPGRRSLSSRSRGDARGKKWKMRMAARFNLSGRINPLSTMRRCEQMSKMP